MAKKQKSVAEINDIIAKLVEGWTPKKDMEIVRQTQYANIGIARKGSALPEETRQKIALASKGRKTFEGKKHTDETRAKMRDRVRGPVSEETRKKQSAVRTGKKLAISEERRAEIIRTNKERSSKAVTINGVSYESATEAWRVLGTARNVIVDRVNSRDARWKDYYYTTDGPKKNLVVGMSRRFVLVSPEGVEYTGYVVTDFLREHPELQLVRQQLSKMLSGTWKQYKGWTGHWIEKTV